MATSPPTTKSSPPPEQLTKRPAPDADADSSSAPSKRRRPSNERLRTKRLFGSLLAPARGPDPVAQSRSRIEARKRAEADALSAKLDENQAQAHALSGLGREKRREMHLRVVQRDRGVVQRSVEGRRGMRRTEALPRLYWCPRTGGGGVDDEGEGEEWRRRWEEEDGEREGRWREEDEAKEKNGEVGETQEQVQGEEPAGTVQERERQRSMSSDEGNADADDGEDTVVY